MNTQIVGNVIIAIKDLRSSLEYTYTINTMYLILSRLHLATRYFSSGTRIPGSVLIWTSMSKEGTMDIDRKRLVTYGVVNA